jgi:hypothetical protein
MGRRGRGGRGFYYNRLNISRCYEKMTTRHRAAPARKHPAARLPYTLSSHLGVPLSPADAGQGESGLTLSGSQTPPPMGVSANVGPQDGHGPPEIGLRAATLLA